MSRLSGDRVDINGVIVDGFDYHLQVWVENGVIQMCGHRDDCRVYCNKKRLAGQMIADVPGHEVRTPDLRGTL